MGQFFSEIAQIWKHKEMVSELAKADFKKRIAGSYFGMVWMFDCHLLPGVYAAQGWQK